MDNWKTSSGPLIGGVRKENTFQAMLAVSGKQAVVHYYNIFKEKAPHLNVTMTFQRMNQIKMVQKSKMKL